MSYIHPLLDSNYEATRYERVSDKVHVVPDQAMSIRQIIDNFRKGKEIDIRHYDAEFDTDNYRSESAVDVTDVQEEYDSIRIRLDEKKLQDKLDQEKVKPDPQME